MLGKEPELAPDLEWLLQSRQTSQAYLIESLVRLHFTPIYQLAVAFLDDSVAAYGAALQALGAAVLNAHQYRSQIGVETWLDRLAWQACTLAARRERLRRGWLALFSAIPRRPSLGKSLPDSRQQAEIWLAVDGLPARLRLPLLAHYALGWAPERIAHASRRSLEGIRRGLAQAVSKLSTRLAAAGFPQADIADTLQRHIQERWPPPALSTAQLTETITLIQGRIRRGSLQRLRLVTLRETWAVLLVLLLVGAGLIGGRMLLGESLSPQVAPHSLLSTGSPANRRTQTAAAILARPSLTSTPTATLTATPAGIFYQMNPGDTLWQLASRLRIPQRSLRQLNRLPLDATLQPGALLLMPGVIPTPTGAPRLTPSTPDPVPTLSLDSTTDEVVLFMADFWRRYTTYWVDARAYLPPEPGAPYRQSFRFQFWIQPDSRGLFVAGTDAGGVELVVLWLEDKTYAAHPAAGQLWLEEQHPGNAETLIGMRYLYGINYLLGWNSDQFWGHSLRLAGHEQVAAWTAYRVVEQEEDGDLVAIYWLDAQSGARLRYIRYQLLREEAELAQEVPVEVEMLRLAYDQSFPDHLFYPAYPWRGSFARDPQGNPE